jgi:hypothetical protein
MAQTAAVSQESKTLKVVEMEGVQDDKQGAALG